MKSLLQISLLVHAAVYVGGAGVDDCIAEKFFRFTPDHTACVLPAAGVSTSEVSSTDKQLIVDKHNELRAAQDATDMQKMVWDDEVASIAQRWTDNCVFAHDDHRNVPGRFSVGQNLAAGHTTWDNAIQAWYDEISDFTYGNQGANSFSAVGHYTQLTWAKSAKIGCGYTYCDSLSYKHFYACNYAVAGNNGDWSKPFTQGTKCAACPNSCSNNICDCGGKVCENGGELDVDTCQCTCDKDWHLEGICALDCDSVTEPNSCSDGGFWGGKCFVYSNAPDECPTYCNVCPYSDYVEGGTDTGTDTGTDGGTDTGTDGGTDTGTDGGTDTGTDTGTDGGTDTGTDTGTDGTETGSGGSGDDGDDDDENEGNTVSQGARWFLALIVCLGLTI